MTTNFGVDVSNLVQALKPGNTSKNRTTATAVVRDTHTEELIIALCGPIGSGHHDVAKAFEKKLKDSFNYDVAILRLSSFILSKDQNNYKSEYDRIKDLQNGGNDLREMYGLSYLATKAIEKIAIDREKDKQKNDDSTYKSRRKCYIIDSIKNPEEYDLFRLTYRELFYCVGIYAPLTTRVSNLRRKTMNDAEIFQLVDRDSGEEIAHGQQVRDAFVRSDFFMHTDSRITKRLENQVERYLNLIFGTEIITPTPLETAMHHAWGASANSACLSRQVGAALLDKDRNIISVGWNDVPKPDGGLYRSIDEIPLSNG